MTPDSAKWPLVALLIVLGIPVSGSELCALKGPNLLLDADFAIEANNPASNHWNGTRHAGYNPYKVEIAEGELTISKIGQQEWFYLGQVVGLAGKRGQKMAFTAELKLDLTAIPGPYAHTSGGGLDIAVRSASKNVIWSSRRNHQPRLGKTGWEKVQVVFMIPPKAKDVVLKFMHQADGTMQVRYPSFRKVDESQEPCPVTPDRT